MSFTPHDRFTRVGGGQRKETSGRHAGPRATKRDPFVRGLYERAKRLGTWNPAEIDLSLDAEQWHGLTLQEQELLIRVSALFVDGEEAVVRDLLPLAYRIGREARLDDELFVTAWLWEEGKHADFFHRYSEEVFRGRLTPESDRALSGVLLLDVELPAVMQALFDDGSAAAQTRALVTYCLVVEGVLAELGHGLFHELLTERGLLPGLRHGSALVRRDESRHIAYGMHALTRLQRADPANRRIAHDRARALVPLLTSLADEASVRPEPGPPSGAPRVLDKPLERLFRRLERIDRDAARQSSSIVDSVRSAAAATSRSISGGTG